MRKSLIIMLWINNLIILLYLRKNQPLKKLLLLPKCEKGETKHRIMVSLARLRRFKTNMLRKRRILALFNTEEIC